MLRAKPASVERTGSAVDSAAKRRRQPLAGQENRPNLESGLVQLR